MFDPFSLWMQGTVVWIKIFTTQQEAYFRFLGAFAQKIPHENAEDLAREAEAVKEKLAPARKARQSAPDHRAAAKKDLAPA